VGDGNSKLLMNPLLLRLMLVRDTTADVYMLNKTLTTVIECPVICFQVRVKETMVLSLVLSSSGQHVQPHEQLLQLDLQTPATPEVPVNQANPI